MPLYTDWPPPPTSTTRPGRARAAEQLWQTARRRTASAKPASPTAQQKTR